MGGKGYSISSISNLPVSMVAQVLSTRVLWTYWKGECSKQAVHVANIYAMGVKLNWVWYLTNEIL